MKLYGVESTDLGMEWFSYRAKAEDQFRHEIEWIEGDDISDDDFVTLVELDMQEFFDEYDGEYPVEDEMEEFATPIKSCKWVEDEDRKDENPRDEGYDFDYWITKKITKYGEDK